MSEKYLVSACLAGARTRFDGTLCALPGVEKLVEEGKALPVCPEQLGGLPTPRPAAEIVGGDGKGVLAGVARVVTREGDDLTGIFIRGSEAAAALAEFFGATRAVLKSRSPSCGCGAIHDGGFAGRMIEGDGVFAAILKHQGVQVLTGEEFETAEKEQD